MKQGRPRRNAGSAGVGRVAGLPGRGDQAGAVPARRRQGVRVHGLLRRRDRHRRRGGTVTDRAAMRRRWTRAAVEARWRGSAARSSQVPPAYSALKLRGPAALRLRARRRSGRAARRATVVVLRAGAGRRSRRATAVLARALLEGDVRAGAGARSRAARWAPGAHVTALRRTRSGPFALATARARSMRSRRLALVGLADALAHAAACCAGRCARPPRQLQQVASGSRAGRCQRGRRVGWTSCRTVAPARRFQVVRADGRWSRSPSPARRMRNATGILAYSH